VDFLVPLVIANFYSLRALLSRPHQSTPKLVAFAGVTWALVAVCGWLGISIITWQHIIEPRMVNRALPTELVRSFQKTGDPQVFSGYRRLFVPHPNPAPSIGRVLTDSRLKGKLPPSLQPNERVSSWSLFARWLIQHYVWIVSLACVGAIALFFSCAGTRGLKHNQVRQS
jgi:hypothetical protein